MNRGIKTLLSHRRASLGALFAVVCGAALYAHIQIAQGGIDYKGPLAAYAMMIYLDTRQKGWLYADKIAVVHVRKTVPEEAQRP